MNIKSYTDSVRPQLAEQKRKLASAVDMPCRIVRNHAQFDTASRDDPMEVPSAQWRADRPEEGVWLDLFNSDGASIIRPPS